MASTQSSNSPSQNNPPIVIVVLVICSGGLVLLSLLTFVLFCFFQKRKEKKTQETDIIHIDEHKKGKETIVPGPFGKQAVVITVEDDVHVDETKKTDKLGHGLHAKSSSAEANHHNSSSQEAGASPGHHQLENKS